MGDTMQQRLTQDLTQFLASLPEDDRINAINEIRMAIHQVSPFREEPVDCVLWVKNSQLMPNDYNPNNVAPPEKKLLKKSIEIGRGKDLATKRSKRWPASFFPMVSSLIRCLPLNLTESFYSFLEKSQNICKKMFDKKGGIDYNITRVIARCTMRLNVNRILHTPGASQDFHFEMDLSDLDFGGMYPVVHPVVVDGRVMNRAGVLHCELQAETTLRSVCARCATEFDDPQAPPTLTTSPPSPHWSR